MLYMLMVKGDAAYEAGAQPSEKMLTEMGKFLDKTAKAGVLKGAGGLTPTSDGMRMKVRDGKTAIIDGPFAEAKEIIGGYAFVEAASKAEIIGLANEFVDAHLRAGVMNADIEIRRVLGGPDLD